MAGERPPLASASHKAVAHTSTVDALAGHPPADTSTVDASASHASASHKLWGGRFAGSTAAALDALNKSIDIDFRLWPYDVRLSKAWAVALWDAGVLTAEESEAIERGLDIVGRRLSAGAQAIGSDEDVHTMIDRMLHDETGDVASKLHTGRSRNDQVATATRLWAMDACAAIDGAVRRLQNVMVDHAAALHEAGALMPAYTHLQRAQPVGAAHWILSHFWPLERDRARLAAAARAAASLPLGSGAVAGCAYPISRVLLRESLGFSSISPNSIDAVSDRDFVAELLFTIALMGAHLSRLAEDLIIYGTSEFGFVKFGDAFSTGSSMMPQKRNPDALELARGSGARLLGDLTALLATLKGLPSSYNNDLQDDQRAPCHAVHTRHPALPAVAGALAECTFDTKRMRAALTSAMMATDLADYLVRKGATFREAHGSVGRLVRESEERSVELHELPLASFRSAHPLFTDDVLAALSPDSSVALREVDGAAGPGAVGRQLEEAKARVQEAGFRVQERQLPGSRKQEAGSR
jgi:argininosuccinate lyase